MFCHFRALSDFFRCFGKFFHQRWGHCLPHALRKILWKELITYYMADLPVTRLRLLTKKSDISFILLLSSIELCLFSTNIHISEKLYFPHIVWHYIKKRCIPQKRETVHKQKFISIQLFFPYEDHLNEQVVIDLVCNNFHPFERNEWLSNYSST